MKPNPTDSTPGAVYLVGAGPGDADLITVAGLKLLRRADAVVYDALVNAALIDEAPPDAERIFVGKRAGRHTMRQEEINELLVEMAQRHRVVVRLKGGDPFVFGRGGEEMSYLREANVPVHIVPGVSSAIAAAAAVGVPVTHRTLSASFAVTTGHSAAESAGGPDWNALAAIDTLVIMMGLEKAAEVQRRLLEAGRDPMTPAMVVCSATLPNQQSVTTTLDALGTTTARLQCDGPATIVIGQVVKLANLGDYAASRTDEQTPFILPRLAAGSALHRARVPGRHALRKQIRVIGR